MRKYGRFALAALFLAATLVSCGSSAGSGGGMKSMDQEKMKGSGESGDMNGMDHEGGMASGMVKKNGRYSDEAFIYAMVPHHRDAVEMAKVALDKAGHEEIRRLARDIISTQRAEIGELRSIKQEEFGTTDIPMQMGDKHMDGMGMMPDPGTLADEHPFDQAFIDAMIPHHQSAIEMARIASEKSDDPGIQTLAENIIGAQKKEIEQMKTWREEWYPTG